VGVLVGGMGLFSMLKGMNRCWQVEVGPEESWKIMLCKSSTSLHYEIVVKDNKKEYVVDAFVKAKQRGYTDELTVIYTLQCGDWVGTIGMQYGHVIIIISDYREEGCTGKLMEIANEVIRRISSLDE